MSQPFIKAEIERIPKCPHPPSQASYCRGLIVMAAMACVIDYRLQARMERQVDDLESAYWISKGIPA